ncbi:MAG: hypothetical protein ACM3KL_00045 [Alphaproteobacteria bacterium]
MSVNAVATARLRIGFWCVVFVMIRSARFFDPGREKFKIKQIGRLDRRRAHHVHLLEWQTEANAKAQDRTNGRAFQTS